MPVDLNQFVASINPEKTVLLFGAGSSIPSHVPSVGDLQALFEKEFDVSAKDYGIAEQTAIIEIKLNDRRPLIDCLRTAIEDKTPTGALLNLPLYNWKSIFTTNYDKLIELSYERRRRPFASYSSNFDFGQKRAADAVQVFKLHGTIDKDVIDGHRSRIILTTTDYDLTEEYREDLFTRFAADVAGHSLIVVGHSLNDPDIKSVVDRALRVRQQSGGQGDITVLSYSKDDGMASIVEKRGAKVCFGGLDDFFAALSSRVAAVPIIAASAAEDPLDVVSSLRPSTIEVAHYRDAGEARVAAMFNGWPASYADVAAGLTFKRAVASEAAEALNSGAAQVVVLLGPSGVGKTTAARQAMSQLLDLGFTCWEHKPDQVLMARDWRKVADLMKKAGRRGCLFIDDAHMELAEINDLIDYLTTDSSTLGLVLTSSKSQWYPRIKTPSFHNKSVEFSFNRVSDAEIDGLLELIDRVPDIRRLVEANFAGFTRIERRQRLINRCDADMFVCLRNIFSSEQFDNIVLREYAELDPALQEIYRAVAAMESAGVRVHRQLVVRLLGISAMAVAETLGRLRDIIHEYTVSERDGVYGWRGRHRVIMGIIAEHKYYNVEKRYDLFDKIIDNISPSYDIEVRTISELCNVETGLATIPDKRMQNVLLRKMMSVAPGERVPRHRLIRNLIALEEYDPASTEIRVFEKDFRMDGPTARYKIDLSVARAIRSKGLLDEDRIAILQRACEAASASVAKFRYNKAVVGAYCEAGLQLARLNGDFNSYFDAIRDLKQAELKTGDRHITQMISRFESMAASIQVGSPQDQAEVDEMEIVE